jgi:hypothetical protein
VMRPTEPVLFAVQFNSCTRHRVRRRSRYYLHRDRSQAHTLPVSSLGVPV